MTPLRQTMPMEHGPRPGGAQRGVALVTVLLVLVALLMLAVGTLLLTSSSLMIAENRVSASIARAQAEAGIDATVAVLFETFKRTGELPPSPPPLARVTGLAGETDFLPAPNEDGVAWYSLEREDAVRLRIVGRGPRRAEYLAEALVEFGGRDVGPSPFRGLIVACESAILQGSGRIDSFDSRLGGYDPRNPGYAGHVITLGGQGIVQITGNAPIYGDVTSAGGVLTTGSSPIYGDIYANGLVDFQAGGGVYRGNVRTAGDVRFSSSAVVQGSVYANGSIEYRNHAARTHGDARAGGEIVPATPSLTPQHHVMGSARPHDHPNIPPVPSEECDPLGIPNVISSLSGLPTLGALKPDWWPYTTWVVTPHLATGKNASGGPDHTSLAGQEAVVMGEEAKVIAVSSLNLQEGAWTRVTGGHVVLLVRGDFKAAGNHKIYIDEGSSLTVLVTGKVELGASFEVLEGPNSSRVAKPVTPDGKPTFSIYSSYDGFDGVKLGGNAKVAAGVYAPFTDVRIEGSAELWGSLRAGSIHVVGGAGFHYDEALGEAVLGGPGASPSEPSFRVLSRR